MPEGLLIKVLVYYVVVQILFKKKILLLNFLFIIFYSKYKTIKGYQLMREVYKQLGVFEPADQTEFANHLISTYGYIDKNNVAVWGKVRFAPLLH